MVESILILHQCSMETAQMVTRRVAKSAQNIMNCSLPSVVDIYVSRCRSRASSIMKPTQQMDCLFVPLPSGTMLWSITAEVQLLSRGRRNELVASLRKPSAPYCSCCGLNTVFSIHLLRCWDLSVNFILFT